MGRTFSEEDFAPAAPAAARVFGDDEFAPAAGASMTPAKPLPSPVLDDVAPAQGPADPRLTPNPGQGGARGVALDQLSESGSDPDAVVRDTPTSRAAAVGLGAAQGATVGQAANIATVASLQGQTGVQGLFDNLFGEGKPKQGAEMVREARSVGKAVREKLNKAQADQPGAFLAGELAGSVAVPGAPKGTGLLKRAARAGAEGAVYAHGTGGDIATGAAVGAGVTGAAGAVGKLVKKGATAVVDKLADRIISEIGEQPGTVGKKVRDRLVKYRDKVVDEVITGPDATKVRQAYRNPDAAKGLEQLKPVVDGLRERLDDGYEAFRKAGKADINVATYLRNLEAQAANPALSAAESRAIKKLATDFSEEASRAAPDGVMDIQRLRQFTSRAQEAAAGAYGGDPSMMSQAAKLKARLSAIASDAMDDWLDANAKGNPKLATAAKEIRENNRRISANLLIQGALESRASQAPKKGSFVAEIAGATGLSLATAAEAPGIIESDEKAEGVAKVAAVGLGAYAAAKLGRRGARAAREAGTTLAIKAAQKAGGIPEARAAASRAGKVAEQVTGALARRAGAGARRTAADREDAR